MAEAVAVPPKDTKSQDFSYNFGLSEKRVNISTYDEAKEVKWWWGRIHAAQARRRWFFKTYANPCLQWLLGNTRHTKDTDDVMIMLILADTMAARPSLFIRRPDYTLSAVQPDELYRSTPEDRIKLGEALLRRAVKDFDGSNDFKSVTKQVLMDAFWAYGVAKVDYETTWYDNLKAGQARVTHRGIPMYDPETGEPMIEPDQDLQDEHFMIKRVSPRNYLMDSVAVWNGVNGTWDGENGVTPYEDMERSGQYNMTGIEKDKGSGWFKKIMESLTTSAAADEWSALKERYSGEEGHGLETDDPRANMVSWAFANDWKDKRFILLTKGNEKTFAMNNAWGGGIEGSIYNRLMFIQPDGDEFYPIPPVHPLIDPAREYNDASRHMRVVRNRAARKIFYNPAVFKTKADALKLASIIDCELIECPDPQAAQEGAQIWNGSEKPLPPADLQTINKSITDFARVGGRPEASRGEANEKTLGQTQIIQGEGALKDEDRRDSFGDFLRNIGRKLWQMMQARLTNKTAVKIAGPKGEEWRTISDRAEIEGEFDVDFEIESVLPKSKAVATAQLDKMTEFVFKVPELAQHVDSRAAAEELQKAHGLPSAWLRPKEAVAGQPEAIPGIPEVVPAGVGSIPMDETGIEAGAMAIPAGAGGGEGGGL